MAILGANGVPSRLWILPVAVIVVIHCIKKLSTNRTPPNQDQDQDQDQKPSDEKKTSPANEKAPVKGVPNKGGTGKPH